MKETAPGPRLSLGNEDALFGLLEGLYNDGTANGLADAQIHMLTGFTGLTPLAQHAEEQALGLQTGLPPFKSVLSPGAFLGLHATAPAPGCRSAQPGLPGLGPRQQLTPAPLLLKREDTGGMLPRSLDHSTSFTIPAFNSLTSRDIIHTDELEDPFGDLADESKLGALPTDEDLRLSLFEPMPPLLGPGMAAGAGLSAVASAAAAAAAAGAGHGFLTPQTARYYQLYAPGQATGHLPGQQGQRLQQQQQPGSSGYPGGIASAPPVYGGGLRVRIAGSRPSRRQLDMEAADEGQAGEGSLSGQSSLGSLKRHMSAADLDADPGSARSKRSNNNSDSDYTPRSGAGGSRRAGASRFAAESAGGVRGGGGHGRQVKQERFSSGSSSSEEDELVEVHRAAGQATTSVYRGVSRHRLTQRWEASLWLAGRQLYLGGFNCQEDAARAYDVAALACKGLDAQINFTPAEYTVQLAEIQGLARNSGQPAVEDVVAYVRRRSSAFSRGKSRYRGVSGHSGRWEARIGSFGGRKNVSFGVFDSEAEAARQYDRALILEKGRSAKTNFPVRDYEAEVAEYEAWLLQTVGTTQGAAAAEAGECYTLPTNRVTEATADDRKRHALIYAEALRKALRKAGGK